MMRRKEREVPRQDIREIIERCQVCRIALNDNGTPYIVPLNFGYRWEEDSLTLFFHCATEGRKLDIIAHSPKAGFEMDCSHKLITAEVPCGYSYEYESIIGSGTIEIVEDESQKAEYLGLVMRNHGFEGEINFNETQLKKVAVLALRAEEFCGKRHI